MRRAFTLLELLVVIAIIGVLSSIVLSSLSVARAKARDAQREEDMHTIFTALHAYYADHGCLPTTTGSSCPGNGGYTQNDAGGWDYSSQGTGFMQFLVTAGYLTKVPVDPINDMTSDGAPADTYAYKYYCYTAGANKGMHLGYYKEYPSWQQVTVGTDGSTWSDQEFTCQ